MPEAAREDSLSAARRAVSFRVRSSETEAPIYVPINCAAGAYSRRVITVEAWSRQALEAGPVAIPVPNEARERGFFHFYLPKGINPLSLHLAGDPITVHVPKSVKAGERYATSHAPISCAWPYEYTARRRGMPLHT